MEEKKIQRNQRKCWSTLTAALKTKTYCDSDQNNHTKTVRGSGLSLVPKEFQSDLFVVRMGSDPTTRRMPKVCAKSLPKPCFAYWDADEQSQQLKAASHRNK